MIFLSSRLRHFSTWRKKFRKYYKPKTSRSDSVEKTYLLFEIIYLTIQLLIHNATKFRSFDKVINLKYIVHCLLDSRKRIIKINQHKKS